MTAKPEQASPGERRILVVDDEPATNALASEYLRLSGFSVLPCRDGASALRLLEAEAFDLVVLDLRMPGLGGLELLKIIRERPRTRSLPVIVLSASLRPGAPAPEGARAVIPKPFSPKDLVSAIRRILP